MRFTVLSPSSPTRGPPGSAYPLLEPDRSRSTTKSDTRTERKRKLNTQVAHINTKVFVALLVTAAIALGALAGSPTDLEVPLIGDIRPLATADAATIDISNLPLENGSVVPKLTTYYSTVVNGVTYYHGYAVDMPGVDGFWIVAPVSGTVRFTYSSATGYMVTLVDSSGVVHRMMHMRELERQTQLEGKPVPAGTRLGRVGSTGASTGPHLHYDVNYGNSPVPFASKLTWGPPSGADQDRATTHSVRSTTPKPSTTTTTTPVPTADPNRGKILRNTASGAAYLITQAGKRAWIPTGGDYQAIVNNGVPVVQTNSTTISKYPDAGYQAIVRRTDDPSIGGPSQWLIRRYSGGFWGDYVLTESAGGKPYYVNWAVWSLANGRGRVRLNAYIPPSSAANVTYRIYDGSTLRGTVTIPQASRRGFTQLGTWTFTSGTIVVKSFDNLSYPYGALIGWDLIEAVPVG